VTSNVYDYEAVDWILWFYFVHFNMLILVVVLCSIMFGSSFRLVSFFIVHSFAAIPRIRCGDELHSRACHHIRF